VPLDPLFDDGRPIEYTPSGPDAGLFAGSRAIRSSFD